MLDADAVVGQDPIWLAPQKNCGRRRQYAGDRNFQVGLALV